MARKCLVCKKELPEGYKLPVCDFHRGVAVENAKKVATGAIAVAATTVVVAKDTVVPVVKEKAIPIATKAIKVIVKH